MNYWNDERILTDIDGKGMSIGGFVQMIDSDDERLYEVVKILVSDEIVTFKYVGLPTNTRGAWRGNVRFFTKNEAMLYLLER